jgi:heme/copper-type cytochrome/quinol oxidase subunit 2
VQHVGHVLFFEVLLTLVIAVWVYTGFRTGHNTIIESIVVAAIFSTIMIAMMYFTAYFSVGSYKAERKLARNNYENNKIKTDVPDVELPLKILFDGTYSFNLKIEDRIIKGLLWRIVILVVIFLSVITFTFDRLGHSTAEMKDEFWIQNNSGIEYAVVYNNGEIAALARIEIEEEIAVIDTSKQKIVAVEDLEWGTQWCGKVELGTIEDESGR